MGIEGVGGWWGGGGNIPPPTIIIMVGMTLTKPWKMHKIRIPPLPWTPKAHLPGRGGRDMIIRLDGEVGGGGRGAWRGLASGVWRVGGRGRSLIYLLKVMYCTVLCARC